MADKADNLALFGGKPVLTPEQHTKWPIVTGDDKKAVAAVLDRGILSGPFAPEARAFEEAFAEYVGARYALCTHSGTSALILALGAAGVGGGDEVIVPSYTFVATPLSVALLGAVPIFVDVLPDSGNMDPSLIEAAISPKTKAIMPVHVHGCPFDMKAIAEIAHRHGIVLVEDAAQAHGATYAGKPVGALHAGGGFSLQSSKNLSAGEGGIYVTNDAERVDLANGLRNFGQDLHLSDGAHYDVKRPLDGHRAMVSQRVGSMYRGNEMMAAFARSQLRRLPELTARAQKNAAWLTDRLGQLPGVSPQRIPKDRTSSHHKYRVRLDAAEAGLDPKALGPTTLRDTIRQALRAEGVEAGMWESAPQPRQRVFADRVGEPWSNVRDPADMARIEENYAADYPATRALLDGSLVLFSHSAPLIGQERSTVEAYANAFEKVWAQRKAFIQKASSGS